MTKAEREALEALADKWATDRNWGGDCVEELRVLLATLDKPATRYDWPLAPAWAMWAATDSDGEVWCFNAIPSVREDKEGWYVIDKNDDEFDYLADRLDRHADPDDWRNSLEHRPDDKLETRTCQCDLRTKLVGDGCDVCNPEYAADHCDDAP